MSQKTAPALSDLVEKISQRVTTDSGISLNAVQDIAGQRIVGPLLFFPAMLVVSPLSLVPTLPTTIAVIVVLVAIQSIFTGGSIWLPAKLRDATLSQARAEQALKFMRPVAKWLDKVSRPRLQWLATGLGAKVAAAVCVLVAMTMPPLEFLPGASTAAGAIIATFGLSLTTEDGLLLLVALLVVAVTAFLLSRLVLQLF